MAVTDPIRIPMLTAAATDETTSQAVPLNNAMQHEHQIVMTQGASAGVVVVEKVPSKTFAGIGEVIFTMDATETDIASELSSGPAMRSISYPGPGGFIRHRITTAMSGGTATSTMLRQYRTGM